MGGNTHGLLLGKKPACHSYDSLGETRKGITAERVLMGSGGPPLLPSQHCARANLLRAATAASRGPRVLRLCVCGPPSAAADFVVYESIAAFNGVPVAVLIKALRRFPTSTTSFPRGPSGATAEALGAPAAAARTLRWLVRCSGALTHIFCPALGALERRTESRVLLHLLFDRAGAHSSAASARSRTKGTIAATQHQQPQGSPPHTFVLEDIEALSFCQQRYLSRLMDAAGVGWILLCRAPHRLCPPLRDQSCCLRFPRPSAQELGVYLHHFATTAAATAAEAAAAAAATAAPDAAYFVALARAAGCEPLSALQLVRRALSMSFPPLQHLCPDSNVQQQLELGEGGQEAQLETFGVETGVGARASVSGSAFTAGSSTVSLSGVLVRKLHRILSRRHADPKTLQALRPVWFEGLSGEHAGILAQLDVLLLVRQLAVASDPPLSCNVIRTPMAFWGCGFGVLLLLYVLLLLQRVVGKLGDKGICGSLVLLEEHKGAFVKIGEYSFKARRLSLAGICAQQLRNRLCAERAGDDTYQAELTSLLATSSAQLREGFLAACLPPTLDLLGSDLLRLRDQHPLNKLKEAESKLSPLEREADRAEVDGPDAAESSVTPSKLQSLDGLAICSEQLETSSVGLDEERIEAMDGGPADPSCFFPPLFGPEE